METYDVVIIGYGPVGALAANLLGQYGIRTAVVEREQTIYPLPRAIVLDDEMLRIFQSIRLIDEILPLLQVIEGEQFLSSTRRVIATATLSSHYNGYAPSHSFYQPHLEAVLRRGVERFPCVRIFSPYEVSALLQDEMDVTVTMMRDGQREEQLRARYVLGCDGAKSVTRAQAGIRLLDMRSHQSWLVVDALLKEGQRGLPSRYVQQYCNPLRPETFVPSSGRHCRWEFMLTRGEREEEMTRPEQVKRLLSSWIDPAKLEIIRATVYTFHALLARQWSKGQMFLLGDAAHQMPPFIGQGMCTGMRDAFNLCWKLALVLRELAPPGILASYQQERAPHAEAVIHTAVEVGNIVQARQPVAVLRDCLLPLLARLPGAFSPSMPPLTAGLLMHSSPGEKQARAKRRSLIMGASPRREQHLAQGILLPQPRVPTASGAVVLLDELLGDSFAMVGLNMNPTIALDAGAIAFWNSLATRFVQVISPEHSNEQMMSDDTQQATRVEDSAGILARWFAHRPGTIAVVRPDRYVFGMFTPSTLSRATQRLASLMDR